MWFVAWVWVWDLCFLGFGFLMVLWGFFRRFVVRLWPRVFWFCWLLGVAACCFSGLASILDHSTVICVGCLTACEEGSMLWCSFVGVNFPCVGRGYRLDGGCCCVVWGWCGVLGC